MTSRPNLTSRTPTPSSIPDSPEEAARFFTDSFHLVRQEVEKVVVGQKSIVDQLLIALFSRGHCMLVGVPGLAKTLLIRTLADSLTLQFSRIQFTPDLMPGDITGTEVIEDHPESGRKKFRFIKGPVFAHIVLADEINRTPPKTQAALLEGMQEMHVTAGGTTYPLEPPFFVLATQNPIEQEGTYPLPEAQLDRFMFNLELDYPALDEEKKIVEQTTSGSEARVSSVLSREELISLQSLVREVPVPDNVLDKAVRLVRGTRPGADGVPSWVKQYLSWGAGPRASQYLILGGKARALSRGRLNVAEEDIRELAIPVLQHRIVTNYAAEAEGLGRTDIILRLLEEL
ncbi:MAG: MoxR family ATPase [Balneolaceae bacterium]